MGFFTRRDDSGDENDGREPGLDLDLDVRVCPRCGRELMPWQDVCPDDRTPAARPTDVPPRGLPVPPSLLADDPGSMPAAETTGEQVEVATDPELLPPPAPPAPSRASDAPHEREEEQSPAPEPPLWSRPVEAEPTPQPPPGPPPGPPEPAAPLFSARHVPTPQEAAAPVPPEREADVPQDPPVEATDDQLEPWSASTGVPEAAEAPRRTAMPGHRYVRLPEPVADEPAPRDDFIRGAHAELEADDAMLTPRDLEPGPPVPSPAPADPEPVDTGPPAPAPTVPEPAAPPAAVPDPLAFGEPVEIHDVRSVALRRAEIVEAVRTALEPHDYVSAAWLAGSDAFGLVDRYSDLDIRVAVDDQRVTDAIAAVEDAFEGLGGVEHRWQVEDPGPPGHHQRLYRLRDTSPYLLVDLLVTELSATIDVHLESERTGTPHVLFDRLGITETVPVDRDALRGRVAGRLEELRARLPLLRVAVDKELLRGDRLGAIGAYRDILHGPLVELLRMRHAPERFDLGMVDANRDLPADVRRRLEDLLFVADSDDLTEKWFEARVWLLELLDELDPSTIG